MRKVISGRRTIHVQLNGFDRMLEKAAAEASERALIEFGIDRDGHSDEVPDWERSCCSIQVEFKGITMSGGMMGWSSTVTFETWCECNDEDEE